MGIVPQDDRAAQGAASVRRAEPRPHLHLTRADAVAVGSARINALSVLSTSLVRTPSPGQRAGTRSGHPRSVPVPTHGAQARQPGERQGGHHTFVKQGGVSAGTGVFFLTPPPFILIS